MRAYDTGINWTWYLEYEAVDVDVIKITKHYRVHHSDKQPTAHHPFRLEENKERIVTGAYINGKYCLVANEQHIFSY